MMPYTRGVKDARLELRIDRKLMERVDAARGDVSRTRWVERALESALGGAEEPVQKVSGRAASAPARASDLRFGQGLEKTLPVGVDRASAFLAASQRKKKP